MKKTKKSLNLNNILSKIYLFISNNNQIKYNKNGRKETLFKKIRNKI